MNGLKDCFARMTVMWSRNVCLLQDCATNAVHGDTLAIDTVCSL